MNVRDMVSGTVRLHCRRSVVNRRAWWVCKNLCSLTLEEERVWPCMVVWYLCFLFGIDGLAQKAFEYKLFRSLFPLSKV